MFQIRKGLRLAPASDTSPENVGHWLMFSRTSSETSKALVDQILKIGLQRLDIENQFQL